jgi:hypothetical protein
MARTIDDFVGIYHVRHGQGSISTAAGSPLIEPGYLLAIGSGAYGDPPSDGIKVGVAVVDPQSRQRILPAEGNPPAYAYFGEGTLNGSTYWLVSESLPELLAFQISLMTLTTPTDNYKAVSLMIVIGDPENAGVWGADDQGDG